jgi:flagella basal body P-ring formation protein FlgA
MSLRWIMAGALAWASFGSQADDLPAAVSLARSELEQRLRDAYPEVNVWALTPMMSDRQMTSFATAAALHIDSVQLGRRSALQVSWRDGEERRRQAVWFDVSGQRAAWILTTDVKRNEPIATEALRANENAAWQPGCSAVSPSIAVQNMRARRALRSGDVLCAENMESKPPVSRGERVLVHSSAGLVTVLVAGIAEQDGKLGDRLQVRNPDSGELYIASVSAEGEVSVRQ